MSETIGAMKEFIEAVRVAAYRLKESNFLPPPCPICGGKCRSYTKGVTDMYCETCQNDDGSWKRKPTGMCDHCGRLLWAIRRPGFACLGEGCLGTVWPFREERKKEVISCEGRH